MYSQAYELFTLFKCVLLDFRNLIVVEVAYIKRKQFSYNADKLRISLDIEKPN